MRILLLIPLLFVFACGSYDDGSVVTTLNWSSTQLNLTFNIKGIACGDNGSVIAVGSGGMIAKSINGGGNWTPASRPVTGVTSNLNGVAFCNNRFMIAGDDHTILYSPDNGATWATTSFTFTDINYQSAACNGSTFLLGGQTTLNVGDAQYDNRTALSTNNGATWDSYKASGVIPDNLTINMGIHHLAYLGGDFFMATDGGLAGYSSGGVTWNTLGTAVNANYNFTGITQGTDNGTKITMLSAVSNDSDNATGKLMLTYDNLTSWRDAGLPVSYPVRGVAFGNDIFVAMTDNQTFISDNITDSSSAWYSDNFPQIFGRINTMNYCGNAFWLGTDRGEILRAVH